MLVLSLRSLIVCAAAIATVTPIVPVSAGTGLNGRIAFSRFGGNDHSSQIYSMLPDGTDLIRLTHTKTNNDSPAWSPDGSQIAYVRLGRSGVGSTLMIMNADGTDRTALLQRQQSTIRRPEWFPDGAQILFCLELTRGSRLIVVGADGTDRMRVGPSRSCDAAVSPDGSMLAFVRSSKFHRHPDLWRMNSDGSGLTQLTSDGHSSGPGWSPDGSQIAYIRGAEWGDRELFVMDADGSNQSRLTDTGPVEYGPAGWSPDGSLIAYNRTTYWDPGASTDVWTVAPDGSNATNLTKSPGVWDGAPDWKPL